MLLEYKRDLQYRFPTKFCLEIVLYLAAKKKARGYYVYPYSRIGSIERALRMFDRTWFCVIIIIAITSAVVIVIVLTSSSNV